MENITRWTGLMIIVSGLMACGNDKPAGPATPPPAAVGVYTAATGDATYYDEYPATVAALNQVDIKPQVSGNITHIFFSGRTTCA